MRCRGGCRGEVPLGQEVSDLETVKGVRPYSMVHSASNREPDLIWVRCHRRPHSFVQAGLGTFGCPLRCRRGSHLCGAFLVLAQTNSPLSHLVRTLRLRSSHALWTVPGRQCWPPRPSRIPLRDWDAAAPEMNPAAGRRFLGRSAAGTGLGGHGTAPWAGSDRRNAPALATGRTFLRSDPPNGWWPSSKRGWPIRTGLRRFLRGTA